MTLREFLAILGDRVKNREIILEEREIFGNIEETDAQGNVTVKQGVVGVERISVPVSRFWDMFGGEIDSSAPLTTLPARLRVADTVTDAVQGTIQRGYSQYFEQWEREGVFGGSPTITPP